MSSRGVSLVREELARVFVKERGDAFRLRITAKDEVLMPRHVFLHQVRLIDPVEATAGDEFITIASPFDATIYPASVPDPQQFPQFFRKDFVDIVVPSTEAAEQAWLAIRDRVNGLIAAYNRLDYLVVIETVRCGAELETTDSLSNSTS